MQALVKPFNPCQCGKRLLNDDVDGDHDADNDVPMCKYAYILDIFNTYTCTTFVELGRVLFIFI